MALTVCETLPDEDEPAACLTCEDRGEVPVGTSSGRLLMPCPDCDTYDRLMYDDTLRED